MITFIYKTLASIGFNHPLHPVLTHIPMGLILGGCIFAIASIKKPDLFQTAKNCYYLALIFIPFTVLFGFMDWQYRFYGKWSSLITAKMVLALIISLSLAFTLFFSNKKDANKKITLLLFILTAIIAIIMGFLGGEILYG